MPGQPPDTYRLFLGALLSLYLCSPVETNNWDKTTNKIIADTALTVFASGAFAEGVQAYIRTATETLAGGDIEVVDIMMDAEGNERTHADFQARWDAATPEQQQALKDTCAKGIEEKVEFSEAGAAHCMIVNQS